MKLTETTPPATRTFTIELDEDEAGKLKALCAKPRGNMQIVQAIYDELHDAGVEEAGHVGEATDGKFYAWENEADAGKHARIVG